jgi:putative Holliday junction resolvase
MIASPHSIIDRSRVDPVVAAATGRNLVYWDERFTSVQAEQALLEAGVRRRRRRELTDKVAAAMMLQGYLDHGANETE